MLIIAKGFHIMVWMLQQLSFPNMDGPMGPSCICLNFSLSILSGLGAGRKMG